MTSQMPSHSNSPETPSGGTTSEKKGIDWAFWTLVALLVGLAVAAITTGAIALAGAGSNVETYGQKGDFFGGFLNPILTFLTFLALLVTLTLQRSELVESRVQFTRSADALSGQNSQSSFYQLLAIHNQIIEGMSVFDPATKQHVHGREIFRVIYSDLRRDFRKRQERRSRRTGLRTGGGREMITRSYAAVYRAHQQRLGHYFRYLYNTLLIVETLPDSKRYIKLLRALLSDQELLVLYYNVTVSPPGENFIPLAVKHVLFDNMPPHLLEPEHATYLPRAAFGRQSYIEKLRNRRSYGPSN